MRRIAKHKKDEYLRYLNEVKPAWLKDHPGCQFNLRHTNEELTSDLLCDSSWGSTVHHSMGRGKFLCDDRYFITLCPVHHDWVEGNKKEARRLGYILYK